MSIARTALLNLFQGPDLANTVDITFTRLLHQITLHQADGEKRTVSMPIEHNGLCILLDKTSRTALRLASPNEDVAFQIVAEFQMGDIDDLADAADLEVIAHIEKLDHDDLLNLLFGFTNYGDFGGSEHDFDTDSAAERYCDA